MMTMMKKKNPVRRRQRSARKGWGALSGFLILSLLFVQSSAIPTAHSSAASSMNIPLKEPSGEVVDFVFPLDLEEILSGTFKIEVLGDLYVATDPDDASFLEVMERLPSGGFGRILRYRGWCHEGKWVDLEFVYQDQENSVTILDYVSGRFFKTIFTEKRETQSSFIPQIDEKGFIGDLIAFQPSSSKFILSDQKSIGRSLPESQWLYSQWEGLSEKDTWSKRHVRGPPGEGLAP